MIDKFFNDILHISKYFTWKSNKRSFMSRLLLCKILFGIKNDMFQVLLSLKMIWRKKIITFKHFYCSIFSEWCNIFLSRCKYFWKKFVKEEKRCWHISFILSHDKLSRNLFNSTFVMKIVQNIPEYQNHNMSQMSLNIPQRYDSRKSWYEISIK